MTTRQKAASTRPLRGPHPRGPKAEREEVHRGRALEEGPPSLRLAIARKGVGLELAQPAQFGCVRVTSLRAVFGHLRFPVDVSGGVSRFRHRRGELQHVELEVNARVLEQWASPRARGIVGAKAPNVWIERLIDRAPFPVGAPGSGSRTGSSASVGVASEADAEDQSAEEGPALAFDVHCVPDRADIVLIVAGARGTGLPAPATALAIACVEAWLAPFARRTGAVFKLAHPARVLARNFFPAAGARVPACESIVWTRAAPLGDGWLMQAGAGFEASAPHEAAHLALQGAELACAGDDFLVAGQPALARNAYLTALERAPRHPDLVRRIAEIDARVPGREEAGLAALSELSAAANDGLALLRGDLLAARGSRAAAIAAYEHAGHDEPTPTLAARALTRAACLLDDPLEAIARLDEALARAPRSIFSRWRRIERRLALRRVEEALADVGQLEALAHGSHAKHAVWTNAGRAFAMAGLGSQSAPVFERALRYGPDDASALGGLGQALIAAGGVARGVSLVGRALAMADRRGEPTSALALALARALAEQLHDEPSAIAHVGRIGMEAPEALVARGLEGKWRASIGDIAGASLAYARLAELATRIFPRPEDVTFAARRRSQDAGAVGSAVGFLVEAARWELARGDAQLAQRHAMCALRLESSDPAARALLREAGERLVGPPFEPPVKARPEPKENPSSPHGLPALEDDEGALERRAEELTRKLQADPANDVVADALAEALESLGRGHELLALLSARLEDAPPDKRPSLLPRLRATLARLAERALASGNADEAALFASAAAAFEA